MASLSLWHQGRWGGSEGEPGPVAGAVEPGTLDLVVTGQGSVTIPPGYGSRVPRDFTLVGDGGNTGESKEKYLGTHNNNTGTLPQDTAKQNILLLHNEPLQRGGKTQIISKRLGLGNPTTTNKAGQS